MFSDMQGWVITRPGIGKHEPPRVITWWISHSRSEAIKAASEIFTWAQQRRRGYRCERSRITVTTA